MALGRPRLSLVVIYEVLEILFVERILKQLLGIVLDKVIGYLLVSLLGQIVKQLQDARMKHIPFVLVCNEYVNYAP